tara:strand:+ start:23536 stop:24069 length:534 start_codon:yes stop_codon:yes gene_type:complete
MKIVESTFRTCVTVFCMVCCSYSIGATVYRTVDENGVVSFSDTQPENHAGEVEQLQIDVTDPQLSDADRQRLEDMRKTTDLMAADRREREQHRAELRQQALATQLAEQAAQEASDQPEYIRYATGNYGYNHHRPYRPWQHWHQPPKPFPPIAKPPLRPMGKGLKLSPTHRTISVPRR